MSTLRTKLAGDDCRVKKGGALKLSTDGGSTNDGLERQTPTFKGLLIFTYFDLFINNTEKYHDPSVKAL